MVREYLLGLYNTIVLKDVVSRRKITDVMMLQSVVRFLADIGLRNVINGTKGGDLGHILENVVYLELARRGGEIYVGKVGDAEIDFVVIKGEYKEYY